MTDRRTVRTTAVPRAPAIAARPFKLRPAEPREDEIHQGILRLLRLSLPREALVFHIPNGGARTPQAGAAMKRLGTLAGIPDLQIVWRGQAYFIEIKRRAGAISAAQYDAHALLAQAGAPVAVCRTAEDVLGALGEWAIPSRIRPALPR